MTQESYEGEWTDSQLAEALRVLEDTDDPPQESDTEEEARARREQMEELLRTPPDFRVAMPDEWEEMGRDLDRMLGLPTYNGTNNTQPTQGNTADTTQTSANAAPEAVREPAPAVKARSHNTPKRSRAAIRIASLNMKGGGSANTAHKWDFINQLIREESLSIIALQETHLKQERLTELQERHDRIRIMNSADPTHPTSRGGVAIVLNNHKTLWKEATMEELIPGRAILVRITWGNEAKLKIAAIYAPSGNDNDNATFWESLDTLWRSHPAKRPDIMLGDMNMVENGLDRHPAHADPARTTEAMTNLRMNHRLQDGWRLSDPMGLDYTFSTRYHNQRNSRSRIDRIYVRENLLDNCDEWDITETGLDTDHSMVSVYITSGETPFLGTGRKAVPDFLTDFATFRKRVMTRAQAAEAEIKRAPNTYAQIIWRNLKTDILEIARNFTKERTSTLDSQINKWKARRTAILKQCAEEMDDEQMILLDEVEENIRDLKAAKVLNKRTNIAAKHHALAEAGTKYDYSLHREKKPRDTVSALKIPGTHPPQYETTSKGMVKIATSHHDSLQNDFENRPSPEEWGHLTDSILNTLKPSIKPEAQEELRTPFTTEEVASAIMSIKNGKASGLDGIPIEIWKFLMNGHDNETQTDNQGRKSRMTADIPAMLTKVLNSIASEGVQETTDFAEGWMCPIYKKKDKSDIANYRPITVLNTDYKVMTKVLTERTSRVAKELIHPDQAGFIKGRSIFDQTELIKTVLHAGITQEQEGAIVCLDQEKAYDKIRHDFLWCTLKKFGFPEEYIRAIQNIYGTAETRVILNGVIGPKFRVTRGVRQGDPLSCLLFDLAIESLAELLRSSGLHGLYLEGANEKILSNLFADDTTVFLGHYDNINVLFRTLKRWCRASGAKFNIDKTVIIPIGGLEYRTLVRTSKRLSRGPGPTIPAHIHIAGEGEPVRILGAFYGHGFEEADIWAPILAKTKRTLERWARDRPTVRGLVLGNNTFVGGYTQYITRVQGMPANVLKDLNRITDDIVYAKNGEKKSNAIGIETLRWSKTAGGLQVLDLQARNEAIGIMTLKTYAGAERPTWAQAADRCLAKAAVKKFLNVGEEFLINPLLQTWKVNLKSRMLTETQRAMMRAAYKFGAKIVTLEPSQAIRLRMPYWYHIGTKEKLKSKYCDKYGKCHRTSHGIKYVEEMLAHARKTQRNSCANTEGCECAMCTEDRLMGCDSPKKCRENANKKLDNLTAEWDPRKHENSEAPSNAEDTATEMARIMPMGNQYIRAMRIAQDEGDHPLDLVRIFTNRGDSHPEGSENTRQQQEQEHEDAVPAEEERVDLYTDGSCHNNGTAGARCGSGLWYGHNDERNRALRIGLPHSSNNVGELAAVLVALQTHNNAKSLTITSDSQYTIDVLTKHAQKWLNEGFSGVSNKALIAAMVGELIATKTTVYMRKVKGHSGDEGNDGADKLADEGANKANADALDLSRGLTLRNMGAKLNAMTQSQAYKEIRSYSGPEVRNKTETMVARVRNAVEGLTDTDNTPEAVWKSLNCRKAATLSVKFRAFAWKALHDGIKVGDYWQGKGACEDRRACSQCNVESESLHHILFECKMTGQEVVWGLAKKAWTRTGLDWPSTTVDLILGAGLITARNAAGKALKGRTRLLQIILTESAYLIWLLRCEWRIGREQNTMETHTAKEIEARWRTTITKRLRTDWAMTSKLVYGRKALQPWLIAETWHNIALNRHSVHPDIVRTGVLVGNTHTRRPPGRNR